MQDFCTEFSMDIANGATPCDDPDTWTYTNSWGHLTRFNYILHSKSLRSFDVSANDELHLGSDHRNDSASIEYIRSMESWKLRKRSFNGWKPTLINSQEAFDIQHYVHLIFINILAFFSHLSLFLTCFCRSQICCTLRTWLSDLQFALFQLLQMRCQLSRKCYRHP